MAYSFNSRSENALTSRRYVFPPVSRRLPDRSSSSYAFGAIDKTHLSGHSRQVGIIASPLEDLIFTAVVGLLVSLLGFLLHLIIFEGANHDAVQLIEGLSRFHFPTHPFNTLFSLY